MMSANAVYRPMGFSYGLLGSRTRRSAVRSVRLSPRPRDVPSDLETISVSDRIDPMVSHPR